MFVMDIDEISKKIVYVKVVVVEVQDMVVCVQLQLQVMQESVEWWQGQYEGLWGQDLGQVVFDVGCLVFSLEKMLFQLLVKLSVLENCGVYNVSLVLFVSIGCVWQFIVQVWGVVSKVKVFMKFNGCLGVQLCILWDFVDFVVYIVFKFYLQGLEFEFGLGIEDYFVMYLGSCQVIGDYMGVFLCDKKVYWVYWLGEVGFVVLSIDEDIGEQFVVVSLDRIFQFGYMFVIVER